MCLSIAVHRPKNVLESGEFLGYEYVIVHNGRGYRCGYLRVPFGHPWHGKGGSDDTWLDVVVHGGITFAENDVPCEKDGPDNAWWVGFDCAHSCDLIDFSLPMDEKQREFYAGMPSLRSHFGDTAIRTTDYVRAECRSLAEQAHAATTLPAV